MDEPKDVRLPIMVTASEADAIDEWRFTNRVPSRAEAIRQLISLGLRATAERAALTAAADKLSQWAYDDTIYDEARNDLEAASDEIDRIRAVLFGEDDA